MAFIGWESLVAAVVSLIRPRVIIGILLLVFIWRGYSFFHPPWSEGDALERQAIQKLCGDVVRELDVEVGRKVHLMRFAGDSGGLVRNCLRRELRNSGKFRTIEVVLPEELADIISGKNSTGTDLRAVEIPKPLEAVIVGYAKVGTVSKKVAKATAAFDVVRFADLKEKDWLIKGPRQATVASVGARTASRNDRKGGSTWSRLLLWSLFVLLLPGVTFFIVRWVIERESNAASLLLLAGYTAADFLFAFFLAGFSVGSVGVVMLLALAFVTSGLYNYLTCEVIAKAWT